MKLIKNLFLAVFLSFFIVFLLSFIKKEFYIYKTGYEFIDSGDYHYIRDNKRCNDNVCSIAVKEHVCFYNISGDYIIAVRLVFNFIFPKVIRTKDIEFYIINYKLREIKVFSDSTSFLNFLKLKKIRTNINPNFWFNLIQTKGKC
ncbi:hypothetical protein [Exercitatus varius]|uniref:hypothetical protein n=1 Tax=Exercitatus varius TaxID=67857 RepID=UPI00294AEED6|nr:hypothetical protein [Exercitatus varius]MDG2959230.1 hypothetical protein [Exercitatus varius]